MTMIQAALNGGRGRDWHPAVPLTPAELAADALAAVAAGAACLHVHPRDAAGLESLDPAVVDAALAAIRTALREIPVGISTGRWIAPGGSGRIAALSELRVRPDYVSVNICEPDAADVIAAARAAGIGVEAGVSSADDVDRLAAMPGGRGALRILVEINEQDVGEALAVFDATLARLSVHGFAEPVLAHGLDASLWPIHRAARARGLDVRTGLEDGRLLADGTMAAGNAALVAAAAKVGHSCD